MKSKAALAEIDRRLLETFSQRTINRLHSIAALRVLLPRLEPFLAKNVAKEVTKDTRIIQYAGEVLENGADFPNHAVQLLLNQTKQIDYAFLQQSDAFSFRLTIPYQKIIPLRTRRIQSMLYLSYRILQQWRIGEELHEIFTKVALEQDLLEIFNLHIEETVALSHSVQLPILLIPLRDWLVNELRLIMLGVAKQLIQEILLQVFHDRHTKGMLKFSFRRRCISE